MTLAPFLAGAAAWLTTCSLAAEESASPPIFRTVVRKQGEEGVHTYRIPALATTPKGTVLALFDVRHKSAADLPADIDVGLVRSTDNGSTWGKLQVILDFDAQAPGARGNGVGDPSVLVNRRTGEIFVAALWSFGNRAWNGSGLGLTREETGQFVITRSRDEGATWSPARSITAEVKDPTWRLCFQGPGAGIQLKDGTLLFPAQYRTAEGPPRACFVYSVDDGEHWRISPPAAPDGPPTSEAQIAELADGSLLLSMRNEARSGQRVWAVFTGKGDLASGSWGKPWLDLPDPTCMASLLRHSSGVLLFSNPNSARRRVAMTVRASRDEGRSWNDGELIDARPSAYSCLSELSDGQIAMLYETGEKTGIETLTFARFPLSLVAPSEIGREP
jgi:sialidase-1